LFPPLPAAPPQERPPPKKRARGGGEFYLSPHKETGGPAFKRERFSGHTHQFLGGKIPPKTEFPWGGAARETPPGGIFFKGVLKKSLLSLWEGAPGFLWGLPYKKEPRVFFGE